MKKIIPLYCLVALLSFNGFAQEKKEVVIETTQLNENIYMLKGQGGNIGLSIGEDGIFMIDDQFARLTPKILEAIRNISDKPIKFLLNTHWHGDHTGGNENMSNEGAVIVAHENVRKRMSVDQFNKERNRTTKAAPKAALPVVTFTKDIMFHMNGEDIMVFHVHHAHTDGDAMVYFTKSNVLHMGDTYFQGKFPYIDLSSGGSIDGYIQAHKKALMLINDDTKIIPGHRNLSNKKELREYVKMLEDITLKIRVKIAEGKTIEEVSKDASITKTYEDQKFANWFINAETIRSTIYKSLTTHKKMKSENDR
ncbi:MAG: MBL fold metallo-hydrolase [Flavobacteriaceae bacterium]|nr:MBL fold metallo-hydrolase [Flavobacteriaceae bacterium]